jgi:hypothetical protein
MATKTEKILIGIDDQVFELTGADKDAFIAQRAEMQKEEETRQLETETQKGLKKSAYVKLGLTEEEINAIL